jgi:hypothetical protein
MGTNEFTETFASSDYIEASHDGSEYSQECSQDPTALGMEESSSEIVVVQPKKKLKKQFHTSVSLSVVFNGRRIETDAYPSGSTYFISTSTAASSDSLHAKKVKFTIPKHYDEVTFEKDVLPRAKASLSSLDIPIEYDEKEHILMHPVLFEDCSITKPIDELSKVQTYHKLAPLDHLTWKACNDSCDLLVAVLPRKMPNRPPIKKSPKKEPQQLNKSNQDGIKVKFYFGGMKFNGKFLSDRTSKNSSRTTYQGEAVLPYPVTKEALKMSADHFLRTGSMFTAFSDEEHVLCLETPVSVPSGPPVRKGGAIPQLPEAREIQNTFTIENEFTGKELDVLVIPRSIEEVTASSIVGGTKADDRDKNLAIGAKRVVDTMMLAMRCSNKQKKNDDLTRGLVLAGDIRNQDQYKKSCEMLVGWAAERIDKMNLYSVHDFEQAITMYIRSSKRDQVMLDSLPSMISFENSTITRREASRPSGIAPSNESSNVQPFERFAYGMMQGNEDKVKYICRLQDTAQTVRITLAVLEVALSKIGKIEVKLTEDAGHHKRFKAIDNIWFLISEIFSGKQINPTHSDTFTLFPPSEGKTRFKMRYFEDNDEDIPLESDGEDDEVPLEGN